MCVVKAPKPPKPPTPPPTQLSPDVIAARSRERTRIRAALGRQGTILTGSGGVSQGSKLGVTTLLGGS